VPTDDSVPPPTGPTATTDPAGPSTGATGTTTPARAADRAVAWWLIGPFAVIALYLLAVPGGRRLARRQRRRAARANGQRVELAWREATGALRAIGLAPRRADTPREFAARAGPRSERAEALGELAEITTAARYSGMEADDAAAGRARDLAAAIVDGVRRQSTAGQRVREELDPRPALRRARRVLRSRAATSGRW
jgi:hypothetical protein